MNDMSVMTAFRAKDNVSDAYKKMGDAAEKYQRRTSTAFRNSTKEGYKFLTIVKGILAANAIRGGLGMIGQSVQSAASEFLNFDDILAGATIKFDDVGVGAKDLKGELIGLKKEVLAMSQGRPFLPTDIAKGIDELAASGFKRYGGALQVMSKIMDAATASGEDLATTSGNLTAILGSFGLRTNDAAQLTENFGRVTDVMTMAANLSSLKLSDLKESMESTGPIAKSMGVDLEEAAAALTILGNAGVKGTEAATSMKNMMMALADPQRSAFIGQMIGGFTDSNGNAKTFSRNLFEVFESAKKAGLSAKDLTGAYYKLFNMRGMPGALTIAKSIGEMYENSTKLKNAKGVTAEQAKAKASLSALIGLMALQNAALSKTFEIFEAFKSDGKSGVESLVEKIQKLDLSATIGFFKATANVISMVYSVLKPFIPIMPYIITYFLLWNATMKAMMFMKFAQGVWLVGTALVAGLGPIGAFSTAMSSLWVVCAPFLQLLPLFAAIGSVGAAGYSLFTGKDNAISKFAQNIGLVPKLSTGNDGKVNGYAPNAKEAQARSSRFDGLLTIAGAPSGSSFENKTSGSPGLNVQMLGVNP